MTGRSFQRRVAAVLPGGLLMAALARALPEDIGFLERMLEKSDLVCKVRVERLDFDWEARKVSAALSTMCVFKGEVPAQEFVFVMQPLDRFGRLFVGEGPYIVFFKRQANGELAYAFPYSEFAVTESAARGEGIDGLWEELLAAVKDPNRGEREREKCLQGLCSFSNRDDVLMPLLEELSESGGGRLEARALAERIGRNDVAALATAAEILSEPCEAEVIGVLAWDGIYYARAEAAVPLLGELIESPIVTVRRNAAHALGCVDSDLPVPLLVKALSDPDLKVAYSAVMGLYRLEKGDKRFDLPGKDYAAGVELFREQPDRYIANWQEWWEAVGRDKYAHVTADALSWTGNPPVAEPEQEDAPTYNEARFIKRLKEAQEYDYSAERVRDTAIAKYEDVLALRPDHPDNLDIELRIVDLLRWCMRPEEQPKDAEARSICERIIMENEERPSDIRVLKARHVLAKLWQRMDKENAKAEAVYEFILDLPNQAIVVPESWRIVKGRRLRDSEWFAFRDQKISLLKRAAAGIYIGSKLRGIPQYDPAGQLAALAVLAAQRPDNEPYQLEITLNREGIRKTLQEHLRDQFPAEVAKEVFEK